MRKFLIPVGMFVVMAVSALAPNSVNAQTKAQANDAIAVAEDVFNMQTTPSYSVMYDNLQEQDARLDNLVSVYVNIISGMSEVPQSQKTAMEETLTTAALYLDNAETNRLFALNKINEGHDYMLSAEDKRTMFPFDFGGAITDAREAAYPNNPINGLNTGCYFSSMYYSELAGADIGRAGFYLWAVEEAMAPYVNP